MPLTPETGTSKKVHWTQEPDAVLMRGEDHPNARLDHRKVVLIRQQYAEGASVRFLANLCGVTRRTIRLVVTRQTWTHLP